MKSHWNNGQPDFSLEEKLLLDLRAQRTAVADSEPVNLEEVLFDLRVDSDDAAPTVRRILLGASDWFEQRTGYAVRPGSYEVLLDGWWRPGPAQIMKGPLRSPELLAVEYLERGVPGWQSLPTDAYRISPSARSFKLYWRDAMAFPALEAGGETVRIRFDAGYDAPANTSSESSGTGLAMPDDMRLCLTAITAFMYQKPEAGRDTLRFANVELDPILQQYRQFW